MTINRDVTRQYIADLEKFGVCYIPQFFSLDAIETLQKESTKLWHSQESLTGYNLRIGLRKNTAGETVLDRLDPVADISDLFARINENPDLVKVVESILKEPARVMKEKLIYKQAKTLGFGLHRDKPYFCASGARGHEMVTVAIALDDTQSTSGPIKFFPSLRHAHAAYSSEDKRDVSEDEIRNQESYCPLLQRGDICLFDGLIPHCSDANTSECSRRMYMITFIPKRYQFGRENYYANRLKEQKEERSAEFGQDVYFK